METDWSSFINPWSRSMEFVIGHHRVVDGPCNPNVFSEPDKKLIDIENNNNNSVEKQRLKEEVLSMLSKPIKQNYGKVKSSKRKRNLAAFVGSIIDGVDVRSLSAHECGSDHGSAVMGEISPHQDDSDPGPQTPPSFQQTRLQENIERFFASQPKTNCPPSTSSANSQSTTQDNSPYRFQSTGESPNHQQTYTNSMDSGINAASSNDRDWDKKQSTPTTTATTASVNNAKDDKITCDEEKIDQVKSISGSGKGLSKYQGKGQSRKNRISTNSAGVQNDGPINRNCALLTEEVLSHHNRIIWKRNHKQQTSLASGSKAVKKMDSSKFKRTCTAGYEINSHTKAKQQRIHDVSNFRHTNAAKNSPNIGLADGGISMSRLDLNLPIGIPVLLNPSIPVNSSNCSRNLSETQLLMPVMYMASPVAFFPTNSGDQLKGFMNLSEGLKEPLKERRSVRLQTDLLSQVKNSAARFESKNYSTSNGNYNHRNRE